MTSQARTTANKSNAARSTGPRTARGKARSKRNAIKHGLSVYVRCDPTAATAIERLAHAIAGKGASPVRLQRAADLAEAEMELRRLRDYKLALIAAEADRKNTATTIGNDDAQDQQDRVINPAESVQAYMRALPILSKLERYERRALSRHRRALLMYAVAVQE
jgi:hypothetical protein